ncbi:hypothetical protein [Peribacillus alkalitolerans]|uniref:hypothetical protein n=1 Tax=Peribacillus alkalitolerans TaxID=1550385 RepID=UPI0013D7C094|nr:hypothetical protein [Peribacillus alkalitolerans]
MMKQEDTKEKYTIILDAIEFFTQRFHLDLILEYSLSFMKRLLDLDKAILFIRQDERLVPFCNEQSLEGETFLINQKLNELPLYYGRILTNDIESYLPAEMIHLYEVQIAIPLINDTHLTGLIISNGKTDGAISEQDLIYADTLMKLINVSIETNQRLMDFRKVCSNLDNKIFNLFVINQSTKALLSELNLENLCSIATDVFSEVSGSNITSFGLYDPIIEKIKIIGYRNVKSFNKIYAEISLKKNVYHQHKIVLHIKKDKEIIKDLFSNWELFEELETEYIILIVKDTILGLVTIGKSRNGEPYDESVFELIETLAASTYIGITNAMLFEEISSKQRQAEKKFEFLNLYNHLSRTINACEDLSELFELSLQTLEVGFGIEQAFFAKRDENMSYLIEHSISPDLIGNRFYYKSDLNQTIVEYQPSYINRYIEGQWIVNRLNGMNCFISVPFSSNLNICHAEEMGGNHYVLVITETLKVVNEEELLILDTLIQNMRPIIYQMELASVSKRSEKDLFLEDLSSSLKRRKANGDELWIFWRRNQNSPFEETSLMGTRNYCFSGYEFSIRSNNQPPTGEGWNAIINPNHQSEVLQYHFTEI